MPSHLRLSSALAVLVAVLGACSPTSSGADAGGCKPDGTTKYICKPDDPKTLVQADSCGTFGTGSATKKCLNDKKCLPSTTGGDAFCGTGNELFCPLDGNQCNCAAATPPILGCNTKGAASGPEETTLSEFDGCGVLKAEVATTCLIGERCWYTWLADGGVNEAAGAHCASSMDPSQKNSPFYKLACDDDIYMFATTGLRMDCRCNRSNAAMQECRPGSDAWGMGLRLGTGPNMHGINLAKWGGGFILNEELFAPVHYTGGNAGNLKPGAIYAINIRTGNRRVVSGSYLGPNGRVDVGSGHTVQGEALPFLTEIKLGADGMIYGLGSNTLTHVEITRVDPTSGARTLIWRRQSLAEASNTAFPYRQCFDGRVSPNYAGGFEPVQYAERSFALGPNGTFYLGWNNDGVGVVQISSDGTSCTHVSRWASRNLTAPLPDIGTGFTPQYGTISGLMFRDGKIYANTKDVLLSIDATTGNRTLWANVAAIGETSFFVDETRQLFFACGTDASRKCSVHRLADGNQAQGLFQIGQTMPVLQGKYYQIQGAKGALDNNNYNGFGAVAFDPTDANILYFVVLSGVIRYEIDTGNSYFMSM